MWSDRTPPDRLRALVDQLHRVLPRPSPNASRIKHKVAGEANFDQAAAALQAEAGFTCLGKTLLHKPLATITYSDGKATLSGPGASAAVYGRGFDILEAMLEAWSGPANAMLAGFIAYDLAAEIENLGAAPTQTFRFPQLYFGLYDSSLTREPSGWSLSATTAWRTPFAIEDAEDLLRRAVNIALPSHDRKGAAALTSQPNRASFEASVERIVSTIHAGDIFQTNLCRCIEAAIEPGAEWDLFERMRAISPAQYEAFLRMDDHQSVLSISPELFLKVTDGTVESWPIKGTRPRAANPQEDDALLNDLLTSEKDRAELAMIVDVVRNDLGRVCRTGSVEVVTHAGLMTLPTVHHLYSKVTGRLREDTTLVDLLRAAFPAASITGAPKIEAMRVAAREEKQLRGPCMGAIGYITLDGRMELSVAIRTAFVTGNEVRYYAGCGITSDSVPANEFEESQHKAVAFVLALGAKHA